VSSSNGKPTTNGLPSYIDRVTFSLALASNLQIVPFFHIELTIAKEGRYV
jgi:hypothetical protein